MATSTVPALRHSAQQAHRQRSSRFGVGGQPLRPSTLVASGVAVLCLPDLLADQPPWPSGGAARKSGRRQNRAKALHAATASARRKCLARARSASRSPNAARELKKISATSSMLAIAGSNRQPREVERGAERRASRRCVPPAARARLWPRNDGYFRFSWIVRAIVPLAVS